MKLRDRGVFGGSTVTACRGIGVAVASRRLKSARLGVDLSAEGSVARKRYRSQASDRAAGERARRDAEGPLPTARGRVVGPVAKPAVTWLAVWRCWWSRCRGRQRDSSVGWWATRSRRRGRGCCVMRGWGCWFRCCAIAKRSLLTRESMRRSGGGEHGGASRGRRRPRSLARLGIGCGRRWRRCTWRSWGRRRDGPDPCITRVREIRIRGPSWSR